MHSKIRRVVLLSVLAFSVIGVSATSGTALASVTCPYRSSDGNHYYSVDTQAVPSGNTYVTTVRADIAPNDAYIGSTTGDFAKEMVEVLNSSCDPSTRTTAPYDQCEYAAIGREIDKSSVSVFYQYKLASGYFLHGTCLSGAPSSDKPEWTYRIQYDTTSSTLAFSYHNNGGWTTCASSVGIDFLPDEALAGSWTRNLATQMPASTVEYYDNMQIAFDNGSLNWFSSAANTYVSNSTDFSALVFDSGQELQTYDKGPFHSCSS